MIQTKKKCMKILTLQCFNKNCVKLWNCKSWTICINGDDFLLNRKWNIQKSPAKYVMKIKWNSKKQCHLLTVTHQLLALHMFVSFGLLFFWSTLLLVAIRGFCAAFMATNYRRVGCQALCRRGRAPATCYY